MMNTELHEAVRRGNIPLVTEILRSDPSRVNDRNLKYETPLHMVYDGADHRLALTKILLDFGADVNAQDKYGYTPLRSAVSLDQINEVKFLLEHGANPNLRDFQNNTVIHNSCRSSCESMLELLVSKDRIEINTVNNMGYTALDRAIDDKLLNEARILMNAGGKARRIFDWILRLAKDENAFNALKFAIQHGAEIDMSGRFSVKALYFLKPCEVDLLEKAMLELGIDVEGLKREGEGTTDLHVAAQNMHEDQVRALLEAGAEVNAKTIFYQTPLHLLLDNDANGVDDRMYRTAELLIEADANLKARNIFNDSPFQIALKKSHWKIVNLMLAKMTDIDVSLLKTEVGLQNRTARNANNPISVAVILGHEIVVDRMIDMRYHVEAMNDVNSSSPLLAAVFKKNYRMTKMLLEAGCLIDDNEYDMYQTISICSEEYINVDLDIVCLLWEFDCVSIFRKPLISYFQDIIEQARASNMMHLLVFLYKIGLRSHKLDKDFISMMGIFRSSVQLTKALASCDEQIDELKKDLVCGNKSKYDLLTMELDSLVKLLNDDGNFKACQELQSSINGKEEFETYEHVMKVRIDLAIEKRSLLDSAKDCLNGVFQDAQINLPLEITYDILSYLSTRELRKMSIED